MTLLCTAANQQLYLQDSAKSTNTNQKPEIQQFHKERIWHNHLHTQMEQRLHLSEFGLNPTNKNTNNSTQWECIYRYTILFQSQYTQTQARSTNKNSLWYKLTVEASQLSSFLQLCGGNATDDPTSRVTLSVWLGGSTRSPK